MDKNKNKKHENTKIKLNNIFQFASWKSSFKKQLFSNILELYKKNLYFVLDKKEKPIFFSYNSIFFYFSWRFTKKKTEKYKNIFLGCLDFITSF